MKRVRPLRQALSNEKKEKPCDQNSTSVLQKTDQTEECAPLSQTRRRQLLQAGRAHNSIIVFCNALAAKEPCAFGAARCCLANAMVEASLVDEVVHGSA
jgi:hypothetical protein